MRIEHVMKCHMMSYDIWQEDLQTGNYELGPVGDDIACLGIPISSIFSPYPAWSMYGVCSNICIANHPNPKVDKYI